MMFDQKLDSDLWSGERSICFFVHESKCYWVIDYKYNFSIDAEIDYRGFLDKGHITKDQFISACESFRGGILKLTEDNFLDYLKGESAWSVSKENLEDHLLSVTSMPERKQLCKRVDSFLTFGKGLHDGDFALANQFVSKLPLFYVNFDRKIYMHMDWNRCHEALVPDDWVAKARDFSWFVPADSIYWHDDDLDLWKCRYL